MGLFVIKTSLAKRVRSLEDYLGLSYDPEWTEHNEKAYAEITKIKERLEALEGKKK